MEHTANRIELCGSLVELPQFSHENHDRRFYRFQLEVERLSGALDVLPVIVPEQVLDDMDVTGGSMLAITGQIRSFNNRMASGRRLVISVYAEALAACEEQPRNLVELTGVVCKEPVYRRTPCIFWGRTAAEAAACTVGSSLSLTGRLQSREYVKVLEHGSESRTAYEVSAMTADFL